MNIKNTKILYVYEERIPKDLQKLVLDHISIDNFTVDSMTYLTTDGEKKKKLEWADIVLFAPGRFLPDEVIASAKKVKLMQLWSSGYDKFNVKACTEFGIPVANNGGANACSVAEHAVLLMLATYKKLPDSHKRTVDGNWSGNSHGMDMFLMHGKKIGILGFGNIGKQVAEKVSGFGVEVMYHDVKRADLETENRLKVKYVTFDELISESDILTLHLHHNKDTDNIISEKVISKMKNTVILINVSRAGLVDQGALRKALEEGKLHGAGLDVFVEEPTKPNDPLLQLPNVVVTPHMAGSTYDTYVDVMKRVVENFRRVAKGESPLWIVNK